MEKQPKYKVFATLLDSFWGYLNSDVVYNRYWGYSENPPHTEEEFHEQKFQDLINTINRVPFESEAADKGTAFNEVIDCLIEGRKSDIISVDKVYAEECNIDHDGEVHLYKYVKDLNVKYKDWTFTFPFDVCKRLSSHYKDAITQQHVEAILPTKYGDVLVYGYIDELMPMSVHDIKTTGSYSVGKFKENHQHLVYPYALMQMGNDVRTFEYDVVEWSRGGGVNGVYTETYVFDPDRDIPILRDHVEQLIEFIEDNRDLITNKKIFAEDE